jgi:hypothetical protein
MIYFGGRRAARLADARRSRREAGTDARSVLNAGAAGLAQQIIDLDRRYGSPGAGRKPRAFGPRYRKVASDYADLMNTIAASDSNGDPNTGELRERVAALSKRCQALTTPSRAGKGH